MNTTLKRSKKMLHSLAGLLVLLANSAAAQDSLSLQDCYARAKENYPLIRQMALLSRAKAYSLANASKAYLPQASLGGQASYQSAVTQIPVSLPNIDIPSLSKDQYKVYAELVQPLTDVISIHQQQELIAVQAEAEEQKLEVELYKLKERIDHLFFGILLLDAQLGQVGLLLQDLQSGLDKTEAAIANGTALKMNADLLHAEQLKAGQRSTELSASRKAYLDMLSAFTGQHLPAAVRLRTPAVQQVSGQINRPELRLYESQKRSFEAQEKLINARNIPRFQLFFQGGLGRPALNFLSNEFDPYYITGLRLNWSISGLYTARKEKQLLHLNQSMIDVQKETFLFNTRLSLSQQDRELQKYQELIQADRQTITLRETVKTTAAVQMANGTLTAIDYLSYINATDQARQNLLTHEVQYLLAQYTYQTISGN
ncbi:MAG: TolC family protein [Chitinophagaceae bacterium]|nr:TolC family protein [Chitinophagaceae bacterium]